MPGDSDLSAVPTASSSDERGNVAMLLARAGLPASLDEIDDLTRAYQSIRGPVEVLYSDAVAALL